MTNRFARLIAETATLNPDLMIEATRRLKHRFLQQRASARYRGVEFRLTFEQWRDWWMATGHIDDRGKQRGQWVMGRPFDSGPYEVGNLVCLRAEDNVSQQNELRAGEYHP